MATPPPDLSPKLVVRPLREDDLPRLEWEGEHIRFRRIFRSAFDDMRVGNRLLLVAEVDGLIVGRLFIQWSSSDTRYADGANRAYLYALRVRSNWQNHGIGTYLVSAAENQARANGFSTATIAVGKDNVSALRLYQRLGYTIFDEDPGVWYFTDDRGRVQREEEASWIMEKHI